MIFAADGLQCAFEGRGLARLDGDHEGQCVLRIAGLLHDGANVDLLFGQCAGNLGHNSGPVIDQEADVMGNLELGADARRDRPESPPAAIRAPGPAGR